MDSLERCRRRMCRALWLLALTIPLGALAQPAPCSRLPQAERDTARQQGLCVDDGATAAMKNARITPAAAGAAAAAAAKANATPPPFQCEALPDYAGQQLTFAQAVKSLPRGFRARVTKRSPSREHDRVARFPSPCRRLRVRRPPSQLGPQACQGRESRLPPKMETRRCCNCTTSPATPA